MAQKRMFSLNVVDTDKFMDMPTSAQALYFHLGMNGDDDGFVSSPKKISRAAGCNADDLKLLAAKGYIIPFESGIIVIADWNRNNSIQKDRYNPTVYKDEKSLLECDSTKRYFISDTNCIQYVSTLDAQNSLEEKRIDKGSIGEVRKMGSSKAPPADKPPRSRFVPPDETQAIAFFRENGSNKTEAQTFLDYYQANGWKISGKTPMKDWQAAARNWIRRAGQYSKPQANQQPQQKAARDVLSDAVDMIQNGDFSFMEV